MELYEWPQFAANKVVPRRLFVLETVRCSFEDFFVLKHMIHNSGSDFAKKGTRTKGL